MIILGIDPGTAITGYGVIEFIGNRYKPITYSCLRTEPDLPLDLRLKKLYQGLMDIIKRYQPDCMAVEELFFNKNARTALAVGHARGIALLAGANSSIPVAEYTPLQVKQAVTGYGKAEKQQIQFMVKTLLSLPEIPKPDDVADALAVAICHAQWSSTFGGRIK
ncbi:Holliday junction endonuclease RuvC [Desulforamulus reducens MI-1]|uniref:Crossover junction endodeoxyribonuclease RuvC n=1 Tax=Desulforamulus reducens (strain ATCC BAA-1160 / DSM 100696 / MI-1) TaxID=349161 RepID=RUVC_DESRM|nr:crossover junction endodeoxyribonuclease RuvC [Desulforamulus reducens]A4J535.1 RecName: Full=Crossover junction endodeoxyribonuclease RuvC; AltName: Full=Holliday junction nuclease RuvC; AltName: Full=Holliday junction resolvase RuvC [Desulforamulus reducens MI-1]ABO50188.1 Holliday junction endonuclease RuvC [Desulforamulus reducens MI-1]